MKQWKLKRNNVKISCIKQRLIFDVLALTEKIIFQNNLNEDNDRARINDFKLQKIPKK